MAGSSTRAGPQPPARPWPNRSYAMTVLVSDVDAHHQRASDEGATILMAPTDLPLGLRSDAAIDLEGRQWELGQPLRLVEPGGLGGTIRLSSRTTQRSETCSKDSEGPADQGQPRPP